MGISFSRGTKISICGNIFENNGMGIHFTSGIDSVFSENHLQNNDIGIFLTSGGNLIEKNNFIENERDATFVNCVMPNRNQWRRNYWNRPRFLPKVITGKILIGNPYGSREFFWINFDFLPAQEPYDI